jgi:pyruvate,water dikinase
MPHFADLPNASFAGQQETYLNIHGRAAVLSATRKCIASLFTTRAIAYREMQGYDHFRVGLSVCIQKMVRADTSLLGRHLHPRHRVRLLGRRLPHRLLGPG